MIPMYRLWLHSLYGLYGPHCPLSPDRLLSKLTHSLTHSPTHPPTHPDVACWLTHWVQNKIMTIYCIFLIQLSHILTKKSLKFVPEGPVHNKSASLQVIAWHQTGDKSSAKLVKTNFTDTCMYVWPASVCEFVSIMTMFILLAGSVVAETGKAATKKGEKTKGKGKGPSVPENEVITWLFAITWFVFIYLSLDRIYYSLVQYICMSVCVSSNSWNTFRNSFHFYVPDKTLSQYGTVHSFVHQHNCSLPE